MRNKLLVFMLDALCSSDLEFMKELPHFHKFFTEGSQVTKVRPVYPALTYCCHTSIVTGTYVDKHTITHNEILTRGGKLNAPWHGMKSDIKDKTILDYAKENGLSTCSLSWPLTGGADYDFNFPMIVPYFYTGYHPETYLENTASKNLMDKYFWKYGQYLKGEDRSLDLITMSLAPDIIEDYGQPDVMMVKMCDLDSVRHTYGVYHEKTKEQLRKHDEQFGVLETAIRKFGDYEHTNFLIIGDHGQTDVDRVFNINRFLKNKGYLETDGKGNITSFKAVGHSSGLSCFVEIKDPNDKLLQKEVKELLGTLIKDPQVQLTEVLDAQEMEERYHLKGAFDFVFESRLPLCFKEDPDALQECDVRVPGDHKIGAATHGGSPDREELTTLLAYGPGIKKGVIVPKADMVDEAPTMAGLLQLEMKDVDGRVLDEILK